MNTGVQVLPLNGRIITQFTELTLMGEVNVFLTYSRVSNIYKIQGGKWLGNPRVYSLHFNNYFKTYI